MAFISHFHKLFELGQGAFSIVPNVFDANPEQHWIKSTGNLFGFEEPHESKIYQVMFDNIVKPS